MQSIDGCGLGLRREFLSDFCFLPLESRPDWIEVVPENWMYIPKQYRDHFDSVLENYSVVAHGLSLSIGSLEPINVSFVKEIKRFLDRYQIQHYSEHLSFSSLGGKQTYELLPIPMTHNTVSFIVDKLKQLQDLLQRPVILENATYYFIPYAEMDESEFINRIIEQSHTTLLLDINNVYVNACNHHFSPEIFLDRLNLDTVSYLHIAGHWCREDDLYLDTHGMPVCDHVWNLLSYTLHKKRLPCLLERDNNIPPLHLLLEEYQHMKTIHTHATT
jgi:uncharacterized protein